MRLVRIAKLLPSVQLRVTIGGDLNAALERYARYYEHIHGEAVEPRALLLEILHVFVDADREFQACQRSGDNPSHRHHLAAAATHGNGQAGA